MIYFGIVTMAVVLTMSVERLIAIRFAFFYQVSETRPIVLSYIINDEYHPSPFYIALGCNSSHYRLLSGATKVRGTLGRLKSVHFQKSKKFNMG